jgi:hypothetical protein
MPNGTYPPYFAGQNATAGLIASGLTYAAWKTGDLSRTSTVTYTADPDLTVPLTVASAVYELEAYLRYEGGTQGASDFSWKWSVPAGTSLWCTIAYKDTAGAVQAGAEQTSGAVNAGSNGAGNVRGIMIKGSVIVSATTGNLVLFWAQATSSATATILHLGSRMSLRRLS